MDLTSFCERYRPAIQSLIEAWQSFGDGYCCSYFKNEKVGEFHCPHVTLMFYRPTTNQVPCATFWFEPERELAKITERGKQERAVNFVGEGLKALMEFVKVEHDARTAANLVAMAHLYMALPQIVL